MSGLNTEHYLTRDLAKHFIRSRTRGGFCVAIRLDAHTGAGRGGPSQEDGLTGFVNISRDAAETLAQILLSPDLEARGYRILIRETPGPVYWITQ